LDGPVGETLMGESRDVMERWANNEGARLSQTLPEGFHFVLLAVCPDREGQSSDDCCFSRISDLAEGPMMALIRLAMKPPGAGREPSWGRIVLEGGRN